MLKKVRLVETPSLNISLAPDLCPIVRRVITNLLTSDCSRQRNDAAMVLGNLYDEAAVPALVQAMKEDSSLSVRHNATLSLGHLGCDFPQTQCIMLPALCEAALNDSSSDVRDKAVLALGRFADKMAVPTLIKVLETDSEGSFVRARAVEALAPLARNGDHEATVALQNAVTANTSGAIRYMVAKLFS